MTVSHDRIDRKEIFFCWGEMTVMRLEFRLGLIIIVLGGHKSLIDGTSVALPAAIIQLGGIVGMGPVFPRANSLHRMFAIPAEMMHCTGTQQKEARDRGCDHTSH